MPAPADHAKVGRLAIRHEGENWNAYYAMPDTMKDAIPLGSIRMAAVSSAPRAEERKQAFINLMRELVADIIEENCGVRPQWGGLETAPEGERSGHG